MRIRLWRGAFCGGIVTGVGLAVLLVGLLVGQTILTGITPAAPHAPAPTGDAAAAEPSAATWQRLADAGVLDAAAMARLDPILAHAGKPGTGLPPDGLDAALRMAGADDVERLPVPAPPAGGQPLAQALRAYAATAGIEVPSAHALAPAISTLRLDGEAEAALSRLVLAYSQAVEMQREATSRLSPQERLLLAADPGALASWQDEHPGATLDDLEGALLAVTQEKVDGGKMMQAADLLARTIDAVRGPLARPPVATEAPASEAPARPPAVTLASGWDVARLAAGEATGEATVDATAGRPPPASLDAALRDLAAAYGLPDGSLPASRIALPASLDAAVAGIVAAQVAGIRAQDGQAQAHALIDAAEAAEPTLRAWSALFQIPAAKQSPPDLAGLLGTAFSAQPEPLSMLAQAQGRPGVAVPAPRPLPALLESIGMDAATAATAAASLPPDAAAALALLLTAEHELQSARSDLLEGLTPAQRIGIAASPHVARVLPLASWSPEDAAWVRLWAEGMAALDGDKLDALRDAQATAAAAAAAAARRVQVPTLPPPADLPGLSGPASATASDPNCPEASPLSRCEENVYLEFGGAASGILVTGPLSTHIDGRLAGGDPHIIIDLGGDDHYGVSAGAATGGMGVDGMIVRDFLRSGILGPLGLDDDTNDFLRIYGAFNQSTDQTLSNALSGRFFSVTIDAGGHDVYASSAAAAHGVGIGLGTVGILWDRGGDDRYEQDTGEDVAYAQGVGADGGIGLLVDEGGTDVYSAPAAVAQGAGAAPVFPAGAGLCQKSPSWLCMGDVSTEGRRELLGSGMLLDLGAGADEYHALRGQGHGSGLGTVGLLLDQQDPSTYRVEQIDFASQGGRGAGWRFGDSVTNLGVPDARPQGADPGGLGALIDLGGAGDTYTSPAFRMIRYDAERQQAFLRHPDAALRKGDDALWVDVRQGIGFGLDTTVADEDGDGHPNVVELAALSDPHGPEQPQDTLGSNLVGIVQTIQDTVDQARRDSDGDGFSDEVERSLGSDPDDPDSTPSISSDPGFLLSLPVLCPADDAAGCDAGPCDDAEGTCVSLLSVAGVEETTHDRPAILSVDLGGNDVYRTVVAGAGDIAMLGSTAAHGSTSIDVGGDDRYGDAGSQRTQGYAVGNAASLLLDLDGDDTYTAAARAQASWEDGGVGGQAGVAMLVDFRGADGYASGGWSQGSVRRQAAADGPGIAALVDLSGDDGYRFDRQATAVVTAAAPAMAMVLDGGGSDVYESRDAGAKDPFATQGHVTGGGGSDTAVGVFADLGDTDDDYWILSGGTLDDVSSQKNDVVRSHAGDGRSVFVDGPLALAQDADGDGAVTGLELLAGTDPRDGDDAPTSGDPDGTILKFLPPGETAGLRLPGLIIGGRGTTEYREYASFIVDLGGDDRYLAPYIGGTALALHGVDPAQGLSTSVLLDVGAGPDDYLPAACEVEHHYGRTNVFTVEDYSQPTTPVASGGLGANPNRRVAFDPLDLTFCPSLGGAALGVALLADDGGSNTFHSATNVTVTANAMQDNGSPGDVTLNVRAWGLAQGASLFDGVGMLLTWDAQNTFRGELGLDVRERNTTDPDPSADAFGLYQGAAWGFGSGLLAAMGGGDDVYEAVAAARAPSSAGQDGGRSRAYAQGAAVLGRGILLDGGGDNTFRAPQGYAQAVSSYLIDTPLPSTTDRTKYMSPLGLLWAGSGDDRYEGSDASQGAALHAFATPVQQVSGTVHHATIALLVEGGGNDHYALAPSPDPLLLRQGFCAGQPSCDIIVDDATGELRRGAAVSQAAAVRGGVAALLDWAGDDRYDAGDRTYAQGVGLNDGHAVLMDMGGNDRYLANKAGQGFAFGTIDHSGLGVLADLRGRDAYQMDDMGQGYAQLAPIRSILLPLGLNPDVPSFHRPAVLLDADGRDAYGYGGQKVPYPPEEGASRPPDDNGWRWSSNGDAITTTTGPAGVGIDASTLAAALALYDSVPSNPGRGSIEVCPATQQAADPECVAATDEVGGVLHVYATVTPPPGWQAQRVSILLDGAHLGRAEPVPGAANRFLLSWATHDADAGVRDGAYELAATAFTVPADAESGGASVSEPDGLSIQAEGSPVRINNPPTGDARLSLPNPHGVSPIVPATAATLSVVVGADGEAPAGVELDPGEEPGGNVTVRLQPAAGDAHVLFDEYRPNGTWDIPVDGHCGGSPCADGNYTISVRIEDASGQFLHLPEMPLMIDGTPPTSHMDMPAFANSGHKGPGQSLIVRWNASDGLSGIQAVAVVRLDGQGQRLDAITRSHPVVEAAFPGIPSGTLARFVAVATDALGNVESACQAEAPPCYAAKAADPANVESVYVDFSPPVVQQIGIQPAIVRPGVDVAFNATVTDHEGQLDEVMLSVDGPWRMTAQAMTEVDGAWRLDVPAGSGPTLVGVEEPFVYKVVARDVAGNPEEAQASGLLDSRPPRLSQATVSYMEDDVPLERGKGGVQSTISLDAQDAKMALVTADVRALYGEGTQDAGTWACLSELAGFRWRCQIPIPEGAQDGAYPVPLTATDAAGNVNTTQAEIVVEAAEPRILDARVVAAGADHIDLAWNTSIPAKAWVAYGKTSALGRSTEADPQVGTEHVVRVRGLSPGTPYHLQPRSASQSGVVNDTAGVLQATTRSAFSLSLPDFPEAAEWSGTQQVPLSIAFLLAGSDVSAVLKVQDAAQAADPVVVESRPLGEGLHVLALPTSAFADGAYRIIVEGARQGDVQRTVSPVFHIDNTEPVIVADAPRPGATVNDTTPEIALVATDPLRDALPLLSTLEVVVDGEPAAVQAEYASQANGQGRIVFELPTQAPGEHGILVRIADAAGNAGQADWTFHIDTAPPQLSDDPQVRYAPGPDAAKPGGAMQVRLNATDDLAVASVAVDLRPWSGELSILVQRGDGSWSADVPLPPTLPDGPLLIPVRTTDSLGNTGIAGHVPITVDAQVPVLVRSDGTADGLTGIRVGVEASEPVTLLATAGPASAASDAAATDHRLALEGLRPGRHYTVAITATDLAGNPATVELGVALPPDDEPPTAPADLNASSSEEGRVVLTWGPARDNAGIGAYNVTRVQDGATARIATLPADATRLVDDAPAGHTVTYRVVAVDVAGLEGPAVRATVRVLAMPRVEAASIFPHVGSAEDPFTVNVTYRHPAGRVPDRIELHHGDAVFPLHRASDAEDCRTGCRYTAEIRLPPLSTVEARPEARIEVETDGQTVAAPVDAPLVTVGAGAGFVSGEREAPAPPWIALAALAAVILLRKRVRP